MRRIVVALVALGLLGPVAADVAVAAPATHTVQVGAVNPKNPLAPYVYTRYYPKELRVHRGDTVRWEVAFEKSADLAFHTITFLPGNTVERPPLARADELPGTVIFNDATWNRTSDCGVGDQPACVRDDVREPLSSGVLVIRSTPPEDFAVRFDLPVGRYNYVCTIHPHMNGAVTVVPPRAALRNPTRKQIEREIAADTAAADAVVKKHSTPVATVVGQQRVFTVVMQPRTPDKHVSVQAYLPSNLIVRAGDRVRWVTHDEIHTVAFPEEQNDAIVNSFIPRCDPDDPVRGAPGVPYPSLDCPAGAAIEVEFASGLATQQRAPGDAVVSAATVHSSGIIAETKGPAYAANRPDGTPWPTEFTADFPRAGTFGYACLVHPELPMTGAVTVE